MKIFIAGKMDGSRDRSILKITVGDNVNLQKDEGDNRKPERKIAAPGRILTRSYWKQRIKENDEGSGEAIQDKNTKMPTKVNGKGMDSDKQFELSNPAKDNKKPMKSSCESVQTELPVTPSESCPAEECLVKKKQSPKIENSLPYAYVLLERLNLKLENSKGRVRLKSPPKTEEEEKLRRKRRAEAARLRYAKLTQEERKLKREKKAEAQRKRQAVASQNENLNPEKQQRRRVGKYLSAHAKKECLTKEERQAARRRNYEIEKERLKGFTKEQREQYLERARQSKQRYLDKIRAQGADKFEEYLEKARERTRLQRANETANEWTKRLRALRVYRIKRQMKENGKTEEEIQLKVAELQEKMEREAIMPPNYNDTPEQRSRRQLRRRRIIKAVNILKEGMRKMKKSPEEIQRGVRAFKRKFVVESLPTEKKKISDNESLERRWKRREGYKIEKAVRKLKGELRETGLLEEEILVCVEALKAEMRSVPVPPQEELIELLKPRKYKTITKSLLSGQPGELSEQQNQEKEEQRKKTAEYMRNYVANESPEQQTLRRLRSRICVAVKRLRNKMRAEGKSEEEIEDRVQTLKSKMKGENDTKNTSEPVTTACSVVSEDSEFSPTNQIEPEHCLTQENIPKPEGVKVIVANDLTFVFDEASSNNGAIYEIYIIPEEAPPGFPENLEVAQTVEVETEPTQLELHSPEGCSNFNQNLSKVGEVWVEETAEKINLGDEVDSPYSNLRIDQSEETDEQLFPTGHCVPSSQCQIAKPPEEVPCKGIFVESKKGLSETKTDLDHGSPDKLKQKKRQVVKNVNGTKMKSTSFRDMIYENKGGAIANKFFKIVKNGEEPTDLEEEQLESKQCSTKRIISRISGQKWTMTEEQVPSRTEKARKNKLKLLTSKTEEELEEKRKRKSAYNKEWRRNLSQAKKEKLHEKANKAGKKWLAKVGADGLSNSQRSMERRKHKKASESVEARQQRLRMANIAEKKSKLRKKLREQSISPEEMDMRVSALETETKLKPLPSPANVKKYKPRGRTTEPKKAKSTTAEGRQELVKRNSESAKRWRHSLSPDSKKRYKESVNRAQRRYALKKQLMAKGASPRKILESLAELEAKMKGESKT